MIIQQQMQEAVQVAGTSRRRTRRPCSLAGHAACRSSNAPPPIHATSPTRHPKFPSTSRSEMPPSECVSTFMDAFKARLSRLATRALPSAIFHSQGRLFGRRGPDRVVSWRSKCGRRQNVHRVRALARRPKAVGLQSRSAREGRSNTRSDANPSAKNSMVQSLLNTVPIPEVDPYRGGPIVRISSQLDRPALQGTELHDSSHVSGQP